MIEKEEKKFFYDWIWAAAETERRKEELERLKVTAEVRGYKLVKKGKQE